MARRPRLAAIAALAGLLLVTPAIAREGPEREEPPTAERPTREQLLLEGVSERLAIAEAAIAEQRGAIRDVDRDLAPLEGELREAAATLAAEQRRVLRGAAAASEFVAAWAPSPTPTLEELSEPLEILATALHVGDDYSAWLLAQVGDLTAHRAEITRLEAAALEVRFSIRAVVDDLQADLALASRTGWQANSSEADGLVARLQAGLAQAQATELAARPLEARIRTLSVDARTQQTSLRTGLHSAAEAEDLLVEGMIAADWTIVGMLADVLGSSPWGPFDPDGILGVCPVDMPNAYTDNWGAPRYSGGYHPHQGIDIFAPEGTPIRAPFPGIAVTAENELGGLAVRVIGETGYVYNAHLSAYGQLGEVETGDVIGYVGNTGNARYSAPHDHFEWHPGGGPAVNPFEALNAACRPVE